MKINTFIRDMVRTI